MEKPKGGINSFNRVHGYVSFNFFKLIYICMCFLLEGYDLN